ncbi:hypothetical protein KM043_011861 [Ampulex compressa]|nr:hypothetical protein KM043_011861 [Ampulex compressa]
MIRSQQLIKEQTVRFSGEGNSVSYSGTTRYTTNHSLPRSFEVPPISALHPEVSSVGQTDEPPLTNDSDRVLRENAIRRSTRMREKKGTRTRTAPQGPWIPRLDGNFEGQIYEREKRRSFVLESASGTIPMREIAEIARMAVRELDLHLVYGYLRSGLFARRAGIPRKEG